jgi:uncharacterized membrane protein
MNRKELKINAKEKLKGKYAEAIKLYLIYIGITFIINYIIGIITGVYIGVTSVLGFEYSSLVMNIIDIISSIIAIIIEGLLAFGMMSFFLKISRGIDVTYKELFNKRKLFWPYIAITLVTTIFTLLWSLLFIIPGIIAALSYSLVYLIKLDHEDYDTVQVINESKKLMNGHKWEYFVLNLSFLGWILLGILTFGLLYFWLIPYMSVTQANFYNYLKEKNCQ